MKSHRWTDLVQRLLSHGALLFLVFALAALAAVSNPTLTQASHSPSTAGYYYPTCSRSHNGSTLWGSNRAYFDATQDQLESWRYNFSGPGLGSKNNNNLRDMTGGWITWYFYSPDSLVPSTNYLQLPSMYYSSMNLGHQTDGSWWYQQSQFIFDVSGSDPSCYSTWIP